jgi:hypothetical protein
LSHEPASAEWNSDKFIFVRIVPVGIAELARSSLIETERYMETFRSALSEVASEFGSGIIDAEDGAVLLSFSSRSPESEEDTLKAVEAARKVCSRLAGISATRTRDGWTPMSVRVAIYFGEFFAAGDGPYPGVITEIEHEGPELIKACPEGQICISEKVLGVIQPHYMDRPIGLIGRADAQMRGAFLLGAPRTRLPASDSASFAATTAIGRERELEHIKRRWNDVARGGGSRFVTLMAAPAMGRTRLLEAFLRFVESRNAAFFVTSCEESTRNSIHVGNIICRWTWGCNCNHTLEGNLRR